MTLFVLDWLIDRRHCDLRWHRQLQELKPKIRASLLSLPKNEDTISRILNKEGNTCMVLYGDISMTFSLGLSHLGAINSLYEAKPVRYILGKICNIKN